MKRRNLEDEMDLTQESVRDLEAYNAKAEKQGKPALSYGYWAAKGKPARP